MRQIIVSLILVLLTACAGTPLSAPEQEVDADAIASHQQSLQRLDAWEFQSRMAFVDRQANDRQAASLRWHHSDNERALRISHPLRGTLARIEETSEGASLTDNQGQTYRARDIESLLMTHLNVFLPIDLIHAALLGRIPETTIINPNYYADGTLASYEVDIEHPFAAWSQRPAQTWQVTLGRYSSVEIDAQTHSQDAVVQLPHELQLRSDDYEIRLSISRWSIL